MIVTDKPLQGELSLTGADGNVDRRRAGDGVDVL
jgi:hypothetical protein